MKKIFHVWILGLFLFTLFITPTLVMAVPPLAGGNNDLNYYMVYSMGGGYINDEIDAADPDATDDSENGGSDMLWFNGGNPETAYRYFGSASTTFSKLIFNVGTTTSSTGSDIQLQYSKGGGLWGSLTITSGARPFESTGVNVVVFDIPGDWATETVNLQTGFYVRTTTGNGVTGAEVQQVSMYVAPAPATPEFSTIVYLLTLCLGSAYIFMTFTKTAAARL